jgi:DNA-binding MarR family transcriptional regulator/N-acetylglutamate synthase-like GNAT family acetyltransferase
MKEDFLREMGYMGLATLLKRVSDTMIHSGRQMYKSLNLDIEPNWYLIFKLLEKHETLSVTEMAQKLHFAHPSVITIVEKMKEKGYLKTYANLSDKRKQQFTLSDKAQEVLPKLHEVWASGVKGMQNIFNNNNLLIELEKLESALVEKNFKDRTLENYLPVKEIQVIPFRMEYAPHFAKLNYDWLQQYFIVEEHDKELLDHPLENIIEKGGQILIAINELHEAVGTVALIKSGDNVYELAKMAVKATYKGYKIGDKLMFAALDLAKKIKAKKVFLETNTKLIPAVNLYKKHGFVEIPLDPDSPYERSNLKMEIIIEE